MMTANVETAFARLRAGKSVLASPGVVTLPDEQLGYRKGILLCDLDGHALQVVEGP
jgi:hypothetical protein